ncbi:MAG TPA: NAD(P)H-dependent oxidoreductase subunit E [Phycisphaerae bacterium]|jgi:NADH-quinone oxidoreductase subunit E|nr:NAD(P)H-dependent oxidoreductase subunit E [Phycisphaerae bacterium]HOJ56104.1 NAD(P)H-dependent oxidoreductase subunit E [Phycisphaerae bacterium]HOL25791.1 NAD(P)H-dependent oxidoreductase subunit E [Phycisphaerae bacterium]HPP19516.1 NAD(P)H-dependent oxidoreductase subunit E [Phycisphaerae bacterium]HPU32630.1 NAD(P)H-dependent oxidoreductase subunit E [Phycisphaerae bacterium]
MSSPQSVATQQEAHGNPGPGKMPATQGGSDGRPSTSPEAPPIDWQRLDRILEEFKGQHGAVIPILQRVQDACGYLPREVLAYISKKTLIPLTQLYGVATFYAQFHLTRRGRHLLRLCDGTACHVRGSAKAIEAIARDLGVQPGQTSPDYKLTFEIVYCLGSCGLAPVAVVDGKVYGNLSPDAMVKRLEGLE